MDAIKQLEQLDCVLMASPNNIHTFPTDESAESEPSFETANTTRSFSATNGGFYPDDAEIDQQYAIDLMNLPAAWQISTGTKNTIKVGVIDSGIDRSHEDIMIPNNQWGIDFTGAGNPYVDTLSHGTHVAGIISAYTNNGTGISGVSWDVE